VARLQAIRSIFRVIQSRRITFVDPTARMRIGMVEYRIPVSVDLDPVREAIDSHDPARSAVAALVAYHGLRRAKLRSLEITDIRDHRLHVDGQVIPMAPQAQAKIGAYLAYRAQRWPRTANPHRFLTSRTAVQTRPVSVYWLTKTLGLSAQAIREDRILNEAHASAGDARRLADLFELSVGAAVRYPNAVDHPSIAETQSHAVSSWPT